MKQTAFIDFLGVTFWMDPSNVKQTIEIILKGWLGVETRVMDTGKGWNGYKHRIDIEGVGLVAYGGNKDTVHLEMTGSGCMQVKDWGAVVESLKILEGRITRIDLAVDDFDGDTYNIGWCREQFSQGNFDPPKGMKPRASFYGDEGSGDGCTYYVGSRSSGKLFRGYEKGKEQGNPESPWFRCEVEWRNRHREIPLDAITEPGKFFAGSYKAFEHHSLEQRQIKTVAHLAVACVRSSMEHAKKQAGRAIHAALALGNSVEDVIAYMHTPELPKRLAGLVRSFLALDESERTHTRAIAPAWAANPSSDEVEMLYRAFRVNRATWRTGQGTNGEHITPRTETPFPEMNRLYTEAAKGAPLPAFA